jgi:hypothetical protein
MILPSCFCAQQPNGAKALTQGYRFLICLDARLCEIAAELTISDALAFHFVFSSRQNDGPKEGFDHGSWLHCMNLQV